MALAAAATVVLALGTAETPAPSTGPKYDVQLLRGALPAFARPKGGQVVDMRKTDGRRYRCHVPAVGTDEDLATAAAAEGPVPSPAAFLAPMARACFKRLEGWWTYELCFMQHMRQYHRESNQESVEVQQEYVLGTYWWPPATDGDAGEGATPNVPAAGPSALAVSTAGGTVLRSQATPTSATGRPLEGARADQVSGEMVAGPQGTYWKQAYGNGTLCDLTGEARQTEVRVSCSHGEPSHIASVEEVSTCRYVVSVVMDTVCKHPAFKASDDGRQSREVPIRCEPVDPAVAPSADATGEAEDGADDAFDLGDCVIHRELQFRGIIFGVDASCRQTAAWKAAMGIAQLDAGENQPFYHVLVDTRDRPGGQTAYVAHEKVVRDSPSTPLQHPLADTLFDGFDGGRYVARKERIAADESGRRHLRQPEASAERSPPAALGEGDEGDDDEADPLGEGAVAADGEGRPSPDQVQG